MSDFWEDIIVSPADSSGSTTSKTTETDPFAVANYGLDAQGNILNSYAQYVQGMLPRKIAETDKAMERADQEYAYDVGRRAVLDARADEQYDITNKRAAEQAAFTMDYNKAALAAQERASAGANAAASASASAAGAAAAANMQMAQTNSRLADSSIKMNDYQYQQMQERDKRWREVGIPQEDALIAKVNELGSEKYLNQQMGRAVGDVQQGASNARMQTMRDIGRMGSNAGGQVAALLARGTADQGLAIADTKNKMRQSFTQADLANKFQLNGAMKGMVGLGDTSANLAINAIGAGKQGYMSGGGGGGGGGGGFGAMGFGGTSGGVNIGNWNGGINPNAGAGLSYSNMGSSGVQGAFQTGSGMASNMGTGGTALYTAKMNNTVAPASGWASAGSALGVVKGIGEVGNVFGLWD